MADLGTLSSLGIGSGVLNYDVIDKLKNADKSIMVKPLENKLDLLKKKESALSQFITIGSTVHHISFSMNTYDDILDSLLLDH